MEDFLTKKTLAVTRGHTYTYYTHACAISSSQPKPTIILIHGWPDDASVWRGVIRDAILPEGYSVIVPDCLGSGDTSKPLDEHEYDFRRLCADFAEILETEGVAKVVLWGHDWVSLVPSLGDDGVGSPTSFIWEKKVIGGRVNHPWHHDN